MEHITRANLSEKASFRYAQLDDLDELMALYERFYAEARYQDFIEWCPERARATIENGIRHHIRPHIIAEPIDERMLVGFISWELDHSFSVKPVAVLFELYVTPEFRLSPIGRFLVNMAVWVARDDGACAFHAPVASGMEAAKSLKNLFVKAGFSELGYIMRKGL